MSAEKCGRPLTIEDIEKAAELAVANYGYKTLDRVISYRAAKMLKRIQLKDPGWDHWMVEAEIWVKAYKLGLVENEPD